MTQVRLAQVSDDPIDPGRVLQIVARPDAGALALFVGVVRDHDPQVRGRIVSLDYTSHPSAPGRMREIVTAALHEADPQGDAEVAAVHRVGSLAVGHTAFVVAVSAPHRRLAFEVCESVVEQVKAELPVWKQQFEEDGSYRWSGL